MNAIIHKDMFGIVIKVRDVVVHSTGYKSSGITTDIVKGFSPVMIKAGYGKINPGGCMVVTESYIKNVGQDKYDEQCAKITFDATAPKTKKAPVKHTLSIYTDGYSGEKCALFYVMNSGGFPTPDEWSDANMSHKGTLTRHRRPHSIGRYNNGELSGDAKVSTRVSNAEQYIPAKMVQKICGGVPLKSTIIQEFDTKNELKAWLAKNHVHNVEAVRT